MSLSRTVSEINGDFSRNLPIFPTFRVHSALAEGIPFRIGHRRKGAKTRMMGNQVVETVLS